MTKRSVKLDRGVLIGAVVGLFVGLIFGTLVIARPPVVHPFGRAMLAVTAYTIAVGAVIGAMRDWLDGSSRHVVLAWTVALTLPAVPVTVIAVMSEGWLGLLILPLAAFVGVMCAASASFELRPWLKHRRKRE